MNISNQFTQIKQPITEVHCVSILLLLAALVIIVLLDDSHFTSVYKVVCGSVCLSVCLFPHIYFSVACMGLRFCRHARGSMLMVCTLKILEISQSGPGYYEGVYVDISQWLPFLLCNAG